MRVRKWVAAGALGAALLGTALGGIAAMSATAAVPANQGHHNSPPISGPHAHQHPPGS